MKEKLIIIVELIYFLLLSIGYFLCGIEVIGFSLNAECFIYWGLVLISYSISSFYIWYLIKNKELWR